MKFYGYGNLKSTIIEHLRDMFRDDGEDGAQPRWKKLTGNDHFFHALGYSFVARKMWNVINMTGEIEDRCCIDLVGVSDKNSLYNDNLLSYDNNKNRIRRW